MCSSVFLLGKLLDLILNEIIGKHHFQWILSVKAFSVKSTLLNFFLHNVPVNSFSVNRLRWQFFYLSALLVTSLSIKRFGSLFSVKLTWKSFCSVLWHGTCLLPKAPPNEVEIFVWGGSGREGWGEGEITRKPDFYVQRYNQVIKLEDWKEAEINKLGIWTKSNQRKTHTSLWQRRNEYW